MTDLPNIQIAIVLLIASAASSGCLGSETISEDQDSLDQDTRLSTGPAPKASPTKDTGSIEGQVADEEFQSIHGASVSLTNESGIVAQTLTDKEGKYTINDIPPGEYGIRFTAPCCEDYLHRVRVEAGDVKRISPTLQTWVDMRNPFVANYVWEGFLSCYMGQQGLSGGFATCSALDSNHDDHHDLDAMRGIHTLLVGMQWDDGFNMNDCLYLELIVRPGHDDYTWGTQLAESENCQQSPIEFRLDAGRMYEIRYNSLQDKGSYDFDNITDHMPLRFLTSAQKGWIDPLPPNIVYQQSFTVHWKEYYWEYAEKDASALPDT